MQRKPFPSETQERFIVRFPDGMRDRISEAAKAGHRSMNAEIVARIRRSFELDEAGDADQAGVEQGAAGLREEISRLCQLLQEHKDAAAGLFEAHKEAVVDEALKRLRSETGMAAGRAPGKR
ncbi:MULTISPECIES: Arc family DNA-binding protein [Delftia]|jgi:hypothetical protein|uniref:DNA-binding protein n=4 Tax=Comamonadaceae TaxID=80864 RepID=A0AAX3SFE1_9BURK|nr:MULTISPECIES: Arc family DNA-binding protein [Delftia]KAA9176117.1 Arc family DNA-binding protein [Delftia sp. BR1]AOV00455.1 DNA-binding protein [Delftia tsuruhatensis]EPD39139.1 hypothetical protein HMPREF9702_04325 [Delftia acidovorans CCUG 15835]EPD41457.1 hypothetical protein HMPREF9701_02012 [Delftia acidovorans CCUG 274B]KEH09298.1 DNA-binding protein [Delftia tsuruhatensis]